MICTRTRGTVASMELATALNAIWIRTTTTAMTSMGPMFFQYAFQP